MSSCENAELHNFGVVSFSPPKIPDNFVVTEKLVKTAKEIIENKKLYYKLRLRLMPFYCISPSLTYHLKVLIVEQAHGFLLEQQYIILRVWL